LNSTKKLIISFVISLVLVLIIQFVCNSFAYNKEQAIYVLNKDIYKGEKLTEEDFEIINVTRSRNINDSYNVDIVDKVAKENLSEGKILQNSDLENIKDFQNIEEKYEYVSIEVKDISDGVAYQLNKGQNINVYFTARDISVNENVQSIVQNTKTIKVLEDKKIIGLYDTSGNEVEKGNVYNAIILRVSTEEAMALSNIKDEGNFNISLVK